jgi:uncharacterized GH25 family protein
MVSRRALIVLSLVGLGAVTVSAHDLFMRPDRFFVAPGTNLSVTVFSGTFSKSENAITRDRLADLSLVSASGRTALDHALWTERDPQSTLAVSTKAPGTYLLGAGVRPRMLKLDGAAFNAYLKDEGLDHVLAARKTQGRLQEGSRERYSKFVKALVQVGDTPSDTWQTSLGYAAELMPLSNPYSAKVGDTLSVRCLVDGKPAAGQILFAGGRTPRGERIVMTRLVADADGVVRVKLTSAGAWYLKFVHMREVSDAAANYESGWSTLTWGMR